MLLETLQKAEHLSMKSLELSPFPQTATRPEAQRRGSKGRNLQAEVTQTLLSQGKVDAHGATVLVAQSGSREEPRYKRSLTKFMVSKTCTSPMVALPGYAK